MLVLGFRRWGEVLPKFFQGDGYFDSVGCLGGVKVDIRGFLLGGSHYNDGGLDLFGGGVSTYERMV